MLRFLIFALLVLRQKF